MEKGGGKEVIKVYDVVAKRHKGSSQSDVVLFYDEDKEKAIKFMGNYNKKNGFTIEEKNGKFTISNIILRERERTGKVISETPYINLFDVCGNRRRRSDGKRN